MGLNRSVLLPQEEIETIRAETGFNSKQIQRLYLRFQELDKKDPPTGYLTRDDLLNIPVVGLNPLGERLVDVLITDYGDIDQLNFRQFLNILAPFRRDKSTKNLDTKEKKLMFLFNMYDRNHDSKIDRDELIEILKLMLGGTIHEEQISTIADQTIGELDSDGDLTISFEEFCNTLSNIHLDEKMSMKFLN